MLIFQAISNLTNLQQVSNIVSKYNLLISDTYYHPKLMYYGKKVIKHYLMYDSGAYSLWKSNKAVSCSAYMERMYKLYEMYDGKVLFINLDVIPGRWGVKPTKQDVEVACKQGYDNYLRLRKTGLPIMPVFHQYDNFEWLDRYLQKDPPIISISPSSDSGVPRKNEFLYKCFDIIRNKIRTHALGLTSYSQLKKFPFYSVDSASAFHAASYGYTVRIEKNKWVYNHYMNIKKQNHKTIHFHDKYRDNGVNPYQKRIGFNVKTMMEMEDVITKLWKERGVEWEVLKLDKG